MRRSTSFDPSPMSLTSSRATRNTATSLVTVGSLGSVLDPLCRRCVRAVIAHRGIRSGTIADVRRKQGPLLADRADATTVLVPDRVGGMVQRLGQVLPGLDLRPQIACIENRAGMRVAKKSKMPAPKGADGEVPTAGRNPVPAQTKRVGSLMTGAGSSRVNLGPFSWPFGK
jgi:hypothetical protein